MSLQQGKIVGYLGDNKYVIELPEEPDEWDGNPDPIEIQVVHDYVSIEGSAGFEQVRLPGGDYPYKSKHGASNWVPSRARVHIPIRDMITTVLPYLQNHKYLQPEHINDRQWGEDDKYFEEYGLTKPRYRKGESYPGYAYQVSIIETYTNEEGWIAWFRRNGSSKVEKLGLATFNEIKNKLKLHHNWWKFNRDKREQKQK